MFDNLVLIELEYCWKIVVENWLVIDYYVCTFIWRSCAYYEDFYPQLLGIKIF